jgi:beta-glucanase (GH16 family)
VKLVYVERFDDPALPGWIARNTEYRTDTSCSKGSMKAVSVRDGILTLKVIEDPEAPGKFLTGHIGTQRNFEFIYGKATARMRVHPYHGAHACFWLAPTTDYVAGQAEIDINEYFGAHNPDRKSGVNIWHNVYWGTEGGKPGAAFSNARVSTLGHSWQKTYHDYTVVWTPDAYTFYVDDVKTGVIREGLSDAPKYLVLSMLVRDWELDEIEHHPLDSFRSKVKWVKVWQD